MSWKSGWMRPAKSTDGKPTVVKITIGQPSLPTILEEIDLSEILSNAIAIDRGKYGGAIDSNMPIWEIREEENRYSVYHFGKWKASFDNRPDAEAYMALKQN